MSKEIWTFKYEPQKLEDMILSKENRVKLEKVINEVPSVLLYGNPGVGKGTFMNIFLKSTGYDYLKINASDENSVDDVRTKIKSFATCLGVTDKKIVYLNEADALSPQAAMAIRDLQEMVQKNTRFFYLANYEHKIPDPIKSRCQSICLDDPPAEEIFKFCSSILKNEGVEVKNKKSLIGIIKKLYPDVRQIVNTLQLNCTSGILDQVSVSTNQDLYEQVWQGMKSKDIDGVRKLLKSGIDYDSLYSYLYEKAPETNSPGDWIIGIGEYLYRHSLVSIKEINFMAFFTQMIKGGTL